MSHGHNKPSSAGGEKMRKISQQMVLRATSLTKSSKETSEQYLQRVTHLHLQGKRIGKIENLEPCTNLKVLYLYDNAIEKIEGLDNATILQYLLLQNNKLQEVPTLAMPSLRKLYLDENEIEELTGLEECERLEELHLANQRIPKFTGLQFDPISLQVIGRTLQVLEISGNGIQYLRPFGVLYELRRIYAGDNQIQDLTEIEYVVSLQYLETAHFLGNPCCKAKGYRDFTVGASSDSLKMLDDLPVLRHQQIAIRGLNEHRKKCGFLGKDGKVTNKGAVSKPKSAVRFEQGGDRGGEYLGGTEDANVLVEINPDLVNRP